MIADFQKDCLNNNYRTSSHPLVFKGATIIEEHGVCYDTYGNEINKNTLYIVEQTHLSERTTDYYRLDDTNIIVGKNTAAKNRPSLEVTLNEEIIDPSTGDIVWDDANSQYIHDDEARYSEYNNCYYHEEDVVWSNFHDTYLHAEDAIWNDEVEDYYMADYRTDFLEWHDLRREEEEDRDDIINSYHGSPKPEYKNRHIYNTGWFVGFEVEKNKLDNGADDEGDTVEPCEFFAGWETDSSCGVEGISHIYNINDPQLIIDIKNASHIDSEADVSCGGHINLSYKTSTYSDNIIFDDTGKAKTVNSQLLKKYMGIIYAMFPQRLIRSYCNSNTKIKERGGIKYSPIRDCGNRTEIRLFNRVKNAQTLVNRVNFLRNFLEAIEKLEVQLNREELLSKTKRFPCVELQEWTKEHNEELYDSIICIDFTYNPHMRYAKYILNACYPALKEIYNQSYHMSRLAHLVAHTYAFTDFIITDNEPKKLIKSFINSESY